MSPEIFPARPVAVNQAAGLAQHTIWIPGNGENVLTVGAAVSAEAMARHGIFAASSPPDWTFAGTGGKTLQVYDGAIACYLNGSVNFIYLEATRHRIAPIYNAGPAPDYGSRTVHQVRALVANMDTWGNQTAVSVVHVAAGQQLPLMHLVNPSAGYGLVNNGAGRLLVVARQTMNGALTMAEDVGEPTAGWHLVELRIESATPARSARLRVYLDGALLLEELWSAGRLPDGTTEGTYLNGVAEVSSYDAMHLGLLEVLSGRYVVD